ncbi:pheromone A receptor-domain-containing protein [Mycena vitilis]|nr:pheromone A receptor-domain-containing protein [Mycena vitilis]
MLPILPVLSFLCAGLLAVFLIVLIRRPTVNTSNVAIIVWLLLGNLVHAVNALVWSSNTETRIPIWCDIVTKVLVGAALALPGVCLCSARYLELLSSSRKIYPNTYSKRIHTLLDVALCYVFPLLYMTLHFAVQDHRFDLLRDFGCSASIHRSTPAVLIMVIPPLILCSISLVLCLLSVWHYARLSSERFATHLSARSSLSVPLFVRRVTKSILLTATVLVVTLFPLLGPRTERFSLAAVHENFSLVLVVRKPSEVGAAQLVWWSIPVVSIVYLLLSVLLGDETTNTLAWLRRRLPSQRRARPELSRLTLPRAMLSNSSLVVPPPPQAVHLPPLCSGWDDMLDVKVQKSRVPHPHPHRKSALSDEYSPSSSPTSSATSAEEDDAFTSSTLTYLASPVAAALGLPSPVSPDVVVANPDSPVRGITTKSTTTPEIVAPTIPPAPSQTPPHPPRARTPPHLAPPKQPIPEDTASTISSIWDAPWPLPPASPVRLSMSPSRSPTRSPSRSPPRSGRAPPWPVYVSTSIAADARPDSPFEDAIAIQPVSSLPTRTPRRAISIPRKPILRGYAPQDVIYMTRTVATAV